MKGIRTRALGDAETPSGGDDDEIAYLDTFLDEQVVEMKKEAAHEDVTRI